MHRQPTHRAHRASSISFPFTTIQARSFLLKTIGDSAAVEVLLLNATRALEIAEFLRSTRASIHAAHKVASLATRWATELARASARNDAEVERRAVVAGSLKNPDFLRRAF